MDTWEGSRQQTGCFVALLIGASAAYTLRVVFRRALFAAVASTPATADYARPVYVLAIALLVISPLSVSLRRPALIVYYVVAAAAIAFSFRLTVGGRAAIPRLIRVCFVTALLVARREQR